MAFVFSCSSLSPRRRNAGVHPSPLWALWSPC